MYLINGESGKPEKVLSFRYALSCFYMNSAVFCKITGIEVVYFQKYVIAILCVVLSFIVVYAIGKIIFHHNMKSVALFVIMFAVINLIFGTEYTTSQFLLLRAYEAKAFCANVVMPTIFWLLMLLYHDLDHLGNWRLLFLVMLSSVPVSMSSILLAPALIGIVILAQIIVDKNWKYLKRTLICMAPNMVYLIVYLLYTLKSTSIRKLMSGRGANIQNLNQQMIMGLEIPLPPIELQNQFADFVQQVNKSKLSVQKSLEKLETLNTNKKPMVGRKKNLKNCIFHLM